VFWVVFTLIWVGYHPYNTNEKTFFEQFNECFIALTVYHIMCFADTVEDLETRNAIGWSLIVCVSFCLVANFAYILFWLAKDTHRKVMTWYYTWKLKDLRGLKQIKDAKPPLRIPVKTRSAGFEKVDYILERKDKQNDLVPVSDENGVFTISKHEISMNTTDNTLLGHSNPALIRQPEMQKDLIRA
jgi:hypothetical protein